MYSTLPNNRTTNEHGMHLKTSENIFRNHSISFPPGLVIGPSAFREQVLFFSF